MPSSQREEELLIIQSIYCDGYNSFESIDDTHFIFRSVPIVLSITLPLSYPDPSHLLEISLDSDGLGISKLQMFQLEMRLNAISQSKPDESILFELTEETREFTEGLREDIKACLEDEEEEEIYDDMFVDVDDVERRIMDYSIVHSHLGSTTIDSIMQRLPSTTKLLHAEIVLRSDLRSKFLSMRRKVQERATHGLCDRRRKDAAWDEAGKQEIVFHGTPRHNVGSIVRSGFIVPGEKTADGERVEVRCGSTWGMGIYTSPDPQFSLSYTDYTEGGVKNHKRLLPGQKLIVCAIIMGRRRQMKHNETRPRIPTVEQGYDSHVSPGKLEYIVFNSAQVLPLYVLHLGEAKRAVTHEPIASITNSTRPEGDLTEYARKHLPHGFGAASGHRFVVLDVAPVDDDEGLWGEYQFGANPEGEFQNERWDFWSNYYRAQ